MPGVKLDVDHIIAKRAALTALLPSYRSGRKWSLKFSCLMEEVIVGLEAEFRSNFPDVPPVSFVATGGFGRGDMAPKSDIDFLIIPLREEGPTFDRAMHQLYRRIEEVRGQLQIRADYSYQLPADAEVLDHKTRTAVLDGRFVAGSPEPWNQFQQKFWEAFNPGEFLYHKLNERSEQLEKLGRTPFLVEPDLKLGFGGLRSWQLANWIGTAIGERPLDSSKAYETVLRMRNLLHSVSDKPLNILTRSKSAAIADLLERDMFAMMDELLAAQHELATIEISATQRLREARFDLTKNVKAIRGDVRISGSPLLSEAAYGIALGAHLGLHVEPIEKSTSDVVEWRELRESLQFGPSVIRDWSESGLLPALLPELHRCLTLLPRDSTHRYSVYEHSVRTVEVLSELRTGDPFWRDVWEEVGQPTTLFIAALLHDVGKIDPTRSHAEYGAEIADGVADRWQIDSAARNDIVWLVQHHLAMAQLVRTRDLQLPETVAEFAQLVETPARLAMLTLLTVADIQSVNPDLWTNLQETSIQDLFAATRAFLTQGFAPTAEPTLRRQEFVRLMRAQVPAQDLELFVDGLPPHYILTTPAATIKEHFLMAQQAEPDQPYISHTNDAERQLTEISVCAVDYRGLLSDILGVLYAFDLTLVGVRAATAQSPQQVAIDTVSVCHAGHSLSPGLTSQVESALRKVVSHKMDLDVLMQSKGKDPAFVQKVFRASVSAGDPTILDIRAPQGRGMAYRISRCITGAGWEIHAARVGQWADHGVAAFYLSDPNGLPISEERVAHALGAASIITAEA